MKLIKLLIILSIFSLTTYLPKQISANEYKVRPYILIPANLKNQASDTKLKEYKENIVKALTHVQDFYRRLLNGKTFDFNNEVKIIYSDKELNTKGDTTCDIYRDLNGFSLIRLHKDSKTVNAVFIYGSGQSLNCAWGPVHLGGAKVGIANYNTETLDNLGRDLKIGEGENLGVVAHELAHSFDLLYAGYAHSHPCTVVSKINCLPGAPEPLPDRSELTGTILGWPLVKYPNLHFNNSTHNPEIEQLYKSLYINPEGNMAPKPAPLPPPSVKITGFTPKTITQGTEIEIKGSGFGNNPGVVKLSPIFGGQGIVKNLEIVLWSDNLIKAINKNTPPYNFNTSWMLRVESANNSTATTNEKDKLTFQSIESPPVTITLDIQLTCGQGNIPVSGAEIIAVNSDPKLFKNQNPILRATAENGLASISYTIPRPQPRVRYFYFAESLEDIVPSEPSVFELIMPDPPSSIEKSFQVHYPSCPKAKEIESKSNQAKQPTAVLISNYPDFRNVNTPDDTGSETVAIDLERDSNIQTIYWKKSEPYRGNGLVYIRKIYSDYSIEDLETDLNPGETVKVDGIEITSGMQSTTKELIKIALVDLQGNLVDYLYQDGDFRDIEVELNSPNIQYKIIRYFSDGSADALENAKVVNFSIETETPQTEEIVPSKPTFSHRTCGDVSGNVIVDVYSDGSEVPGTNCEDLDKVCQVFDSEGRQDATCVEQQLE